MVGLRGGFNDRQNFERVKADGAGQNDQFDDVDPALAAFKTGNKGLVASEPVRQVFLTVNERLKVTRFQRLILTRLLGAKAPRRTALI